MLRAVTICGALLLLLGPAIAERTADCLRSTDSERQIKVCSSLIAKMAGVQRSDLKQALAHVYLARGLAYLRKSIKREIAVCGKQKTTFDQIFCPGRDNVPKELREQATADFTEAIRLDPRFGAAYRARGLAGGSIARVIADFDKAIKINSKDWRSYLERARIHLIKELGGANDYSSADIKRALRDYSEAIKINPRSGRAYKGRALVWSLQNEYERARKDYREALRIDPSDEFAARQLQQLQKLP